MIYNIFTQPPEDFNPKVAVAGCFCEFEDKLLYLKRHPEKVQGSTWGIPAGKLEPGETPRQAVIREVFEETGLNIENLDLIEVGVLYMRLPHVDYIWHVFRARFDSLPTLNLGLEENTEFLWVTPNEARQLHLITGGGEALQHYLKTIE